MHPSKSPLKHAVHMHDKHLREAISYNPNGVNVTSGHVKQNIALGQHRGKSDVSNLLETLKHYLSEMEIADPVKLLCLPLTNETALGIISILFSIGVILVPYMWAVLLEVYLNNS